MSVKRLRERGSESYQAKHGTRAITQCAESHFKTLLNAQMAALVMRHIYLQGYSREQVSSLKLVLRREW